MDCDVGTWREVSPKASTPAERKSEVCKAHKLCSAGQWTKAKGSATKDTECESCSSGRFRKVAPTGKASEVEANVCVAHRRCRAGEWTVSVGTAKRDTGCEACPAGTARPSAPSNKTTVETASSSCPACTGASEYSDERGLKKCKTCAAGHFGVDASGSESKGGHTACDDDTCERPTRLPANAVLVVSKCPAHGKHGAAGDAADTCTLACAAGFYSTGSSTPFTCAADGAASTASYQGGAITCRGEFTYRLHTHRTFHLSRRKRE